MYVELWAQERSWLMQISDEDLLKILTSIRADVSTLTATVDRRLNTIEKELYGYRITIRVLKWIGALTVAVLTLRFGDIKNLFT